MVTVICDDGEGTARLGIVTAAEFSGLNKRGLPPITQGSCFLVLKWLKPGEWARYPPEPALNYSGD